MTTNENNDLAINFINVSKIYHTYSTPQHRLLEIISGGRKRYAHETRALDNVSFSLKKGGRLGIIGENGSGKSTLLKVLAGVLTPSSGKVHVNGRISALLELGAGFNPELLGIENIRQFCMLHGMHSNEIEEAVPNIIKFSELKDAINYPVKTYSSGMAVRLGFACAVYVKPEILIVDEALSVGDAYFQNKCLHKIKSLLDDGATFIYVTHAADAIRSLCDQGLWMEKGRVRNSGSSSNVGGAYQAEVYRRMVTSGLSKTSEDMGSTTIPVRSVERKMSIDHFRYSAFEERVAHLRSGSGEARILDISLIDENGVDIDTVEFDKRCLVRVFYHARLKVPDGAALTVGITDSSGNQIVHFNSASQGVYVSGTPINQPQVIEFQFENKLCPGEYGLIAGIGVLSRHPTYQGLTLIDSLVDHCAGGARFSISHPAASIQDDLWGVVRLNYQVRQFALD
jgi:lipopolysaccharide transport system ATP-binding protein